MMPTKVRLSLAEHAPYAFFGTRPTLWKPGKVHNVDAFVEEYQTVNPQNSDAIVEHGGTLEVIAAPLNPKKFATLG